MRAKKHEMHSPSASRQEWIMACCLSECGINKCRLDHEGRIMSRDDVDVDTWYC